MEKEVLNLTIEIKNFLTQNYSFNVFINYITSKKIFNKDENFKDLIINLIKDDKFIKYINDNNNLNNNEVNEIFFNILNYLYLNCENNLIYSLSKKLNEPFKNYSLIYFLSLTKKYDFYLSEINNLLIKDNLNDWIKLFHIFYTRSNNLNINLSPKLLLLKNKKINLNKEIVNFFSDFLISNYKLGTLNYYLNEFESFEKIKDVNILKKLLNISCLLNNEEINFEISKDKDIKFLVIETIKKIIKKEDINKIEKNFDFILNLDKTIEEFNFIDNKYLFPNIKYYLFKSKLLKSQSLLQNNHEINNLKKIILNFIYNDPGYEPFYSILLYFYTIINEKENFYTLYEKYQNLFNLNLIQNESIINLCKSFFILKDYEKCKNILNFYKGKFPDILIKINRFIQK